MSSLKEATRFKTNRPFRLDLAEDNGLTNALHIREATFNEDVLPRDAELMAPSDFYAAIASDPSPPRPTTRAEGARLFPYLAA
ncbi:hypothetical protein [Bradyrhizobium sp. USDA 4486]